MDIILWQKVQKHRKLHSHPPPLISVNMQLVLSTSSYGYLPFVTTLRKGGGTFEVYLKFLSHITSMIVDLPY